VRHEALLKQNGVWMPGAAVLQMNGAAVHQQLVARLQLLMVHEIADLRCVLSDDEKLL
jgi:hypothetical protein